VSRRALAFGSVAEAYERFRPGYPDEIVALVSDYAGRPLRTALDIGAGTGKATRLFAADGIVVTAVEPDAAMLAELRRQVPGSVSTVRSTFEQLQLDQSFDLVYAAAALHWTEPERRWSRVASLLAPGGVFANFGGPARLADDDLEAAVRAAGAPFMSDDEMPASEHWPADELEHSEWFDDVRSSVLSRRLEMTAADYVGHLSTVSAYLVLSAGTRQLVLERIQRALPPRVEVAADVTVHLARRR
jgi:SAM-dependent methyltransferase